MAKQIDSDLVGSAITEMFAGGGMVETARAGYLSVEPEGESHTDYVMALAAQHGLAYDDLAAAIMAEVVRRVEG